MSGEIYQIETRGRSRSKTPFLRSSCNHENCEHAGEEGHVHHHDKKKKQSAAPNFQSIVEEHTTVTTTTSSSSRNYSGQTRLKANAQGTQLTSDYSSDDTSEEKRKQQNQSGSAVTNFFKKTSQKMSNALDSFTTSTPTNQSQLEMTQNKLNFAQEQGSGKRATAGKHNGNASAHNNSDHLAYLEYKSMNEYWNETPKTDYTYSELSPHRRILAPGQVAMPNMSRRSLEGYDKRVNFLVEQYPEKEEFIRRRYQPHYSQQYHLNYDSGDEVDITRFEQRQQQQRWWLVRFITTIVTTISSAWSRIINVSGASETDQYHTYYARQQRGVFASIIHGLRSGLLSTVSYLYLFIASVLSLDTWLLKSSNPENKSKKRFLLFLLILLPLLLLTAWSLLEDEQRLSYVQRAEALLPLPLTLYASLRQGWSNAGASLKSLFELPAISWPSGATDANEEEVLKLRMENMQLNMKKSLTPEEYENILNHVNSYVQNLVELKLQQQQHHYQEEQLKQAQQLTPQQIQIIVQLMRENLQQFASKSELSEAEIAALALRLKFLLQESGEWQTQYTTPLPLTTAHIEEIRRLITAEVHLKEEKHYTLLLERIDLNKLLERILAAPALAEFVDARIHLALDRRVIELQGQREAGSGHFEQQLHIIDELNREIAFVKLALSDKHSENADLQQSISNLKLTQDDLLERMQQHELAQDKRFSGLLAEIETKLATLKNSQFKTLNKQVKLTLVEILGFKQSAAAAGNTKLDDVDLQNWVRSMFVAKDYLEQQLLELNKRTNNNIRDEIERSSILLMNDISERLKREILLIVEAKHNESHAALKGHIREEEVRNIVRSVLAIYDADKTGLVDFALESAGGQILSTRCTESYQTKSAQISVFGIPLWYPSNTPRVAISPNVHPGECWAFQGFPGYLVLKLNSLVYVTGFTLEHIPKSLSPTGRIDSAPRNFTVWGLTQEKDQDPIQFGDYEYQDNGASLQYFAVQNVDIKRPYDIVELRIETNHGQPTYTCLYRFRVHGKPPAV